MSITFEKIHRYLKENIVESFFTDKSVTRQLIEVKLIIKDQREFKDNTIYVGTSNFVYKNKINLLDANIILINDSKDPLDEIWMNAKEYIILKGNCDLFEQFNLINNIFNNYMKLDAMREYSDINQIATKASELLENPVIFIDSSYRVLAHSSDQPIIDTIWKQNIERGYCSYEFISYVRNMKKLKNSLNDSTPFLLNCYKSEIEKYASKFFVRGELMGYIIILIEGKEFSSIKKELTIEISKIVASSYEDNLSQRNFENLGYENLLMDLLDNRITDSKTLNEKIKIYNESFKSQKVILLLDILDFDSKKKPVGYLSQEIDRILNKRHIYYENKIVVLYDFSNSILTKTKQIKQLKEFALTNNIIIGVSNIFSDLILIKEHYLQAKKVLRLKEKIQFKDSLLEFKDVSFYALLHEIEKYNIDFHQYTHPSLEILKTYDKKNEADLYVTLYTYLKNNQNAVSTGRELYLHRNTVKYRIDKIIEATDLDLSNEDQVFNLLFSYKLIDYTRKNQLELSY